MNNKNLTILIGNPRGGEECWNSMYTHLLLPLNSDLALCFGKSDNKTCSLYNKANYVWEIPEYEDWCEYYKDKLFNNWKNSFLLGGHNLAGGLENYKGSGAIIFAFRHWLKNNVKNIMQKYDNIILTRSDFYYLADHPKIQDNKFYVLEGEDYGGITDRHCIFSHNDIDDVLGVVEFMDSDNGYKIINEHKNNNYLKEAGLNPEKILLLYYTFTKIINKVERLKRVQFTVALETDQTRWTKAIKHFQNDMFIKYENEYLTAKNNLLN